MVNQQIFNIWTLSNVLSYADDFYVSLYFDQLVGSLYCYFMDNDLKYQILTFTIPIVYSFALIHSIITKKILCNIENQIS